MSKLLIVGAGGFAGAILRFAISGYVQGIANYHSFPFGTLAVNVLGCFIIGVIFQLTQSQWGFNTEMQLLLIVGFVGSFTTFATFGHETLSLIQDHKFFLSLANMGAQMFLGLGSVFAGRFIAGLVIN